MSNSFDRGRGADVKSQEAIHFKALTTVSTQLENLNDGECSDVESQPVAHKKSAENSLSTPLNVTYRECSGIRKFTHDSYELFNDDFDKEKKTNQARSLFWR
mmetsp:Transcript_37156/g.86650  ORF Transcript_37156/g.86650 Transcript_37156/m.86650 type:complete len:102 (+) Transcript_37156:199-504(+)